jgi:hypothetical protein
LDPRPFTFGELQGMLEAYEYAAWDHTASLLTCVTGLVKKGVDIKQFHPYRRMERNGVRATAKTLSGLKGMLPVWKDPVECSTTVP